MTAKVQVKALWRTRNACAILGIALGAALACGDGHTTAPGNESEVVVSTDGSAFLPTFVNIRVGGTVRWEIVPAGDGDGHDVTFRPGVSGAPANIPVTLRGTVDRIFNVAGVFAYDCKVHPGMWGEVTVAP
jgi:plastocyanin